MVGQQNMVLLNSVLRLTLLINFTRELRDDPELDNTVSNALLMICVATKP